MKRTGWDESCIQKFKPMLDYVVYKTSVEITGRHISGILLIKKLPDSSTRVVFSSQLGFSYFDFGFLPENGFKVYQIIPLMNRKPLIRTLRKDFDLILYRTMDSSSSYSLSDKEFLYHAYPQKLGVNYYVTDSNCQRLIKMQRASDKEPVMEAYTFGGSMLESPDSIIIRHLNFSFTITLKKITQVAPQ